MILRGSITSERGMLICDELREKKEGRRSLLLAIRVISSEALLKQLSRPDAHFPEQWQAQILAQLQRHARVLVYSTLPSDTLRACHLEPCRDVSVAVREQLNALGPGARVAVLPYGPLTIPYLRTPASPS